METTLKLYRRYNTETLNGKIRRKCDGSALVFSESEDYCNIGETIDADSYISYKSSSGTTGSGFIKQNQEKSAYLHIVTGDLNFNDYFSGAECLTSVDFSNINTPNLSCKALFKGCKNLETITGLERLTSISEISDDDKGGMFDGCEKLTGYIDLSRIDHSYEQTLSLTFCDCHKIEGIKLGTKSKVSGISQMCFGCKSLKVIDMSAVDLSSCNRIDEAFNGCEMLEMVDLTSLSIHNVIENKVDGNHYDKVFEGCNRLRHIRCNAAFKYYIDRHPELTFGLPDIKDIEWHVAW